MIATRVTIVRRGQPVTRLDNMVRPATTPQAPKTAKKIHYFLFI